MRPRIILSANGTLDASKVSNVSEINKHYESVTGLYTYSFDVYCDGESVLYGRSEDLPYLKEIRRRLIGFIWPNADVFDPSKNDAAL
jgi:hypothetical protein